MLDVHPAHHAAGTWRDFLIHITTIVLGLLIAIGLEQTVEMVHHHHQRRELEIELHEEARKNLILIAIDKQGIDQNISWLTLQLKEIAALRFSHGNRQLPLHPLPTVQPTWVPDPPAWETAKESGLVALLPPEEGAMYNLVYTQQDFMHTARDRFILARSSQSEFELRFSDDPAGDPQPDTSRMSSAELSEYESLVIESLTTARRFQRLTNLADTVTRAAYDGTTSDEQLLRMMGGRPAETSAGSQPPNPNPRP